VWGRSPWSSGPLVGEPTSFDRQAGARRATGRAKARWGRSPRSDPVKGAGTRVSKGVLLRGHAEPLRGSVGAGRRWRPALLGDMRKLRARPRSGARRAGRRPRSAHEPPAGWRCSRGLAPARSASPARSLRSKRPRVRRLSDLPRSEVPKCACVSRMRGRLTDAPTLWFLALYRA